MHRVCRVQTDILPAHQYALAGEMPGGPLKMPDINYFVVQQTATGTVCRYLPPHIRMPGNSEQVKESRIGRDRGAMHLQNSRNTEVRVLIGSAHHGSSPGRNKNYDSKRTEK